MAAAAAAPYARVMEDMVKGREYATQLQALLQSSSSAPEAGRLVDQILHAMSRTIQTAKAAAAAEEASEVQSDVTCAGTGAGGKRKAAAAGGGGGKRPACRSRTQGSSVETKNLKDLEAGHAWRKYGQKEIQNCKHPKAYFRCTHKFDQQCLAQRQVQRRDDDPDVYTVTYIGVHTCQDPATAVAPVVVHADELHAGSRLISFAANANASAATTSTTTTTTGNTSSQQTEHKDGAALLLAGPMKLESGGEQEQEEVVSSLTPAGSSAAAEATRNNAAAAAASTPGPDQGDVTSGLQQPQHGHGYGDDDLADMAAHFGYDDTFWALYSDFGLDRI